VQTRIWRIACLVLSFARQTVTYSPLSKPETRQMSTRVKDAGKFFEAEIATFDRFWQCQFLGAGLSCIQASDIGAPSAGFCCHPDASPFCF
ncbi:MAG: hypothetical protein WBD65_03450, partial [Methylocella sp.]